MPRFVEGQGRQQATLSPECFDDLISEDNPVNHIALADHNGEIIGSPIVTTGVIHYPLKKLGLCAGITHAPYRTTTEVYPDSSRVTDEQCVAAQIVAVAAASG